MGLFSFNTRGRSAHNGGGYYGQPGSGGILGGLGGLFRSSPDYYSGKYGYGYGQPMPGQGYPQQSYPQGQYPQGQAYPQQAAQAQGQGQALGAGAGAHPQDAAERLEAKYAGTVNCPKCSALVPAGSKFCLECGEKLGGGFCAQCGTPLAPNAKFCPECGTPRS